MKRANFKKRPLPHKLLESLVSEDDTLLAVRANFGNIDSNQNVFAALQTVGVGDATSLSIQTFRQLCENPSVAALLIRMAQTELIYTVSIKGLIVFLEKGGTYEELNPADVRAFKKRMGGTESSFSYPLLGVAHLNGSHLRSLFELHRVPSAREAFLKLILE